MNDKQMEIASRLAGKINGAERSVDSSIEHLAGLFSELSAVRRHANVGAQIAQPICDQLAGAIALLVQARGCVVAAHCNMASGAAQMDFEPFTGEGGQKPTPPSGMIEAPAGVVAITRGAAA